MAKNTNGKITTEIRYKVLDRCFSDFDNKYFIEDLLKECNDELRYLGYATVTKDMINKDIANLKLNENIELDESCREGRRKFYRYKKQNFSLYNLLSKQQLEQLNETIAQISRISAYPQFKWMEDILDRLKIDSKNKQNSATIVEFDQNDRYKGREHFEALFNAIIEENILEIDYNPNFEGEIKTTKVHPYFLKQYNGRWFLFGHQEKYSGTALPHPNSTTTFALDRICKIRNTKEKFRRRVAKDYFSKYFSNIVGVTKNSKKSLEEIELVVKDKKLLKYIESKPIHRSQKIKDNTIFLELIPNYEFRSLLLPYADRLEIIKPISLKKEINEWAKKIILKNNFPL